MYKQTLTVLAFGFSLVLCSASCGPTCPAGQQSCGTSNPSTGGGGGEAGATSTITCPVLTAVKTCMKAYCATATNPFCTCYKRGYDIDSGSCKCIDLDAKTICDQANGDDGSTYDCAAASSGVSTICVPVN